MKSRITDKQMKEFWEWCGLDEVLASDGEYHWFKGEEIVSPTDDAGYPVIDLNNLFRWAVPKLSSKMAKYEVMYLLKDWIEDVTIFGKDPALALFWAIWNIKEV